MYNIFKGHSVKVRVVCVIVHQFICWRQHTSVGSAIGHWVIMIFSMSYYTRHRCMYKQTSIAQISEAWNPPVDSQHKFQREILCIEQQWSIRKVNSYLISGLNFVCTFFVHTWNTSKSLTLHYICFCNKVPSNM